MIDCNLSEAFDSLVLPLDAPEGLELAAVPIPGALTHRVGKDSSGRPCVLINHGAVVDRQPPIRLEHLLVSFDVPCTIRRSGAPPESRRFTILRCSSSNPRLFRHFLTVVAPIVVALGPAPSPRALRDSVNGLVDLFQALGAPARRTIQGLWSELLLICQSADPPFMASAWHRDPRDRFDFGQDSERLEVKSATSRRREHYFSLEQLDPAPGARVVVASVVTERIGGGTTLRALYEEARSFLATDASLLARLDSVVFQSLGESWEDALEEPFDRGLAASSLAFFAAENIPRVINPAPASLADVRFRADLGSVGQLSMEELQALGGLFRRAAPPPRV